MPLPDFPPGGEGYIQYYLTPIPFWPVVMLF